MSDNKTSSFADKAAKAAAIGAGIVAAAAVIPQDELMKTGLPSLWESIKGIAELNLLRLEEAAKKLRPTVFAWGTKLWSFIKWWAVLSIALVVAGIQVKTTFESNVGHVLVAAGTISFAGLGIALFFLTDGIASLLYLKLKVAGSIFGKVTSIVGVDLPQIVDSGDLEKFRGKVRMVLAVATILCFSLLFTMFFPAWSTLGWTLCIWAIVGAAASAALYLNLEPGPAIRVVLYASIALLVGVTVIFILDRLTGGSLGFAGFQKWLRAINRSELLAVVLVLIPVGLILTAIFSTDKHKKCSYLFAAKYVGIGCAFLGVFLLYKGTISWKQLSGKAAPKVVTEIVEKAENASFKGSGDGSPGTESGTSGSSTGKGQYLSPPQMDAIVAPPSDHVLTPPPSKPRAKKQPLPPLKAKKYDNAANAVDDLESLL